MKNCYDFLQNYLFMRCFSKEEYLRAFVSGKSIYMNSAETFWRIENQFQGDTDECCVVSKNSNTKWSVWVGNEKPEKKVANVVDLRFSIKGFLYCMFALPKSFFAVDNGILLYDEENAICQDFFNALNQYCATVGPAYICIFDAFSFMNRIREHLELLGLNFACGWISYKDTNETERLQHFMDGHFEKIVFTKQEKYRFQHEFRIFISDSPEESDHLELVGVPLDNMIFLRCKYNPKLEELTNAD